MYLSVYDGGRGGLRIVPEGQGEAVVLKKNHSYVTYTLRNFLCLPSPYVLVKKKVFCLKT